MQKNKKKQAELIKKILADNYQPERQDRCKVWVYRNIINPIYPMSERTFWRHLQSDTDTKPGGDDPRQTKLF
ncbi:MAG: YbdD/YjiX family protein [Prevotellaceae bacterium]|nr:YbdD/YjiX family protein [Prevotellaceae bacterium]